MGSLAAGVAVVAGVGLSKPWGPEVQKKLLGSGPMKPQTTTRTPPNEPVGPQPRETSRDSDGHGGLDDPGQPTDAETGGPQDPATSPPQEDTGTEPLPVRKVEVICRDALGLVAATDGGRQHEIRQLTLHHTAVPLERNELAPSRLRGHQRYHQQAGWPDIAYHYGVDLAGHVFELRDPRLAGDTFTSYDPAGHFLVVCEGDYDREHPTDAMLQRIAELFAHAALTYGADPQQIGGHRDYAGTTCPGDRLQSQLPDIRLEVSRLVARERVELASLCGAPARALVEGIEASRT